jgi:catechol 2,3-dioxygenase-like lactoylglutathione lyase family enzyme
VPPTEGDAISVARLFSGPSSTLMHASRVPHPVRSRRRRGLAQIARGPDYYSNKGGPIGSPPCFTFWAAYAYRWRRLGRRISGSVGSVITRANARITAAGFQWLPVKSGMQDPRGFRPAHVYVYNPDGRLICVLCGKFDHRVSSCPMRKDYQQ